MNDLASISNVLHFSQPFEVHLWIAEFDRHTNRYEKYYNLLSETEKQRGKGFRTEFLQIQYSISRGLLRELLSYYLSKPHHSIDLLCNSHGKPFLFNNASGIQFNLSHSGNIVVYAITRSFSLGVDIECIKPELPIHNLQKMIFSESESKKFCAMNQSEQLLAFYRAWTRKEAFLKALGTGLSKPLTDVEIEFHDSMQPKVICVNGNSYEGEAWSVVSIENIPGYIGAVAARIPSFNVKIFLSRDCVFLS